MHISHDFIATKTCPSCEFLVVFGQVRVSDRNSAGRGRARFLELLRVRVRAGADKKFQPAQDYRVCSLWLRAWLYTEIKEM